MKVKRDDGHSVLEVFDVLPRRVEPVRVVEVTQRREEAARAALLVSNDQPPLATLLDVVRGDDGAHPPLRLVHELLVDLERVVGSLFEESLVGDLANVDARFRELLWREGRSGIDKVTL